MNRTSKLFSIFVFTLAVSPLYAEASAGVKSEASSDKDSKTQRTLVWSDEFSEDGPVSDKYWSYEQGFVRNHEDQWYQPQNAYCKDGLLIIEARCDSFPNPMYEAGSEDWRKSRPMVDYTSASINTRDKFDFKYGTLEVRARIPVGPGAWPAIWTLGSDMPWPNSGEIDVMEYYRINGVPHILANAAWGSENEWVAAWNSKTVPFSHFLEKDPEWASRFHVWRMDWDENSIKIYLDDELINDIDVNRTANKNRWNTTNPMRQPHYILLNLAMGGDHGGEISKDAMPLRYEIDYVRVYR